MKTVLFAPCYLVGDDALGNSRFERTKRWLQYYDKLRDELGFHSIYLCDNASPPELMQRLRDESGVTFKGHSFENHLSGGGYRLYPYCWRALYATSLMFNAFEKVITIDTDGFLLSKRLAEFVKARESGWTAFHEQLHSFPTAEFHILCQDAWWVYREFTQIPFMGHMGKLMEESLPFTEVRRDFDVERSGEKFELVPPGRTQVAPPRPEQDFYGQASLTTELVFK